MNPDVRHALHAFAVLDGAFIVREDGVVVAAGRYLNFDEEKELDVPLGLGRAPHGGGRDLARHRGHRHRRLADLGLGAGLPARQGGARAGAARPAILSRVGEIAGREFARRSELPDTMPVGATQRPAYQARCAASSCPVADRRFVARVRGARRRRRRGRREGARSCSSRGTTYFDLGQFDKAIEAWQQGYRPEARPGLPLQHRAGLPAEGGRRRRRSSSTRATCGTRPRRTTAPRSSRRSRRCRSSSRRRSRSRRRRRPAPIGPTTPPPPNATTPPPPTRTARSRRRQRRRRR